MVVEHNIVLSSWILLTLTLCVCLAWQPIDQEVDSCVWLNQLQHNFVLRSWTLYLDSLVIFKGLSLLLCVLMFYFKKKIVILFFSLSLR